MLGRFLLTKKFSGDLDASARGHMLSAGTGIKGSAGYVAIDQVTGSLDGRKGSFVLQHSGSMKRGAPTLSVMVVPDSGTGELEGLTGTLSINIVDGKHFYDFLYSVPCELMQPGIFHARSPRKAIGRVARPPVGVARAQPRRGGNFPHRFRRARCGAAGRRLAAITAS